jgi:putative nucleotidyltransferase with HDIG domain
MKQIDDTTFAHSINVAMIARLIGVWCDFPEEDLDMITLAGLLHDIGKCQIPDEILMKPQKLSKQEYEFVKMHAQFGYDIIKGQDLDRRVKRAVLHHHERCDGSGYPQGLSLEQMEDFESIISIADVYDAMTADRCYRSGLCPFEVISFFEQEGLQKYHPKYITTFLQKIANSYLNSDVLLSNNQVGRIVYINSRLTRPIVQLRNRQFMNLLQHPDIYIQSIV